MPLDPNYWLAQQLRQMQDQLKSLVNTPVLANASSDGDNGYLKISANAVSGLPAIELHYTGGGGDLLAQLYQTTGGAIQITGGLQVSGTKNFVMAHPTQPGWILRHASTESPVNGVEYWGESVLGSDGTVVVTLPAYFEALTHPQNRNVQLTAIGAPTSLAYDRIANGAFTVRGVQGTEFSWLVKAERASQPGDWPIDFVAEETGDIAPPPVTDTVRVVCPSSPMVDEPAPAPSPAPAPADPTPAPADPSPAPSDPAPAPSDPAPPPADKTATPDSTTTDPTATPLYMSST
jgi:hypothetical protein